MEQLTLQSIAGAIIVLGCSFYAINAFLRIFWTSFKLIAAVAVGIMVTDLTIPAAKPFLNSATTFSIEDSMKSIRGYASVVGASAVREFTTIATNRS